MSAQNQTNQSGKWVDEWTSIALVPRFQIIRGRSHTYARTYPHIQVSRENTQNDTACGKVKETDNFTPSSYWFTNLKANGLHLVMQNARSYSHCLKYDPKLLSIKEDFVKLSEFVWRDLIFTTQLLVEVAWTVIGENLPFPNHMAQHSKRTRSRRRCQNSKERALRRPSLHWVNSERVGDLVVRPPQGDCLRKQIKFTNALKNFTWSTNNSVISCKASLNLDGICGKKVYKTTKYSYERAYTPVGTFTFTWV